MRCFLFISCFLLCSLFSYSQKNGGNLGFSAKYVDSSIDNSLHLGMYKFLNSHRFEIGLRYHLKRFPVWDQGQLFFKTSHNFTPIQAFGLYFQYLKYFHFEKIVPSLFVGVHSQFASMGRRFVSPQLVGTGTFITFDTERTLKRWENDLVTGASFPITDKLHLELTIGIGRQELLDIDPKNRIAPFEEGKWQNYWEISRVMMLSLSYSIK